MRSAASAVPISRTGPRAMGSSGLIERTLPRDAIAHGGLQCLEREHRALHACRADLDAKVVEHVDLAQLRDFVEGLALDVVGEHRSRRLADRAASARELDVLNVARFVDAEHQRDAVATEG